MKTPIIVLLALTASFAAAGTVPEDAATPGVRPDDLPSREFGYEVFRHIYRWYLDADQLHREQDSAGDPEVEVWIRRLDFEGDPDDNSIYLEVLIPLTQTEIILKKADYAIPELGAAVKNKDFRIVTLEPYETAPAPEDAYLKVVFLRQEIFDHLYATRNQKTFPDQATRQSLGRALIREARSEGLDEAGGDQIFYLAPLSPVTNDIWVFWESQRKLIRFTSDADYDSEFYWMYPDVGVQIIDLDEDIVVSLSERPESDSFVTKEFAGRVLYNCIVLGMKIVVPAEEARAELAD